MNVVKAVTGKIPWNQASQAGRRLHTTSIPTLRYPLTSTIYSTRITPCQSFIIQRTTRSVVAKFSSSDGSGEVSDCARNLSKLGASITGNDGGDLALQLAQRLSPSARQEISSIIEENGAVKESKDGPAPAFSTSESKESSDTIVEGDVEPPSPRDLELVMINQMVPFIGFGFMDNFILILAGDAIDQSLGVVLGISTLCAAALGNIVSDCAGVFLGTAIEDVSVRLGIPVPNLTAAQRKLRSVRFAGQFGVCVGLIVGCIIGMFPLLFIDTDKVERKKREAEMDSLFRVVVTEANDLIGAEATRLFIVRDSDSPRWFSPYRPDKKNQYLFGKYADGITVNEEALEVKLPLGTPLETVGIAPHVAVTGKAVSLKNPEKESYYDDNLMKTSYPQHDVKNLVSVPVLDANDNVIAVILAVNKVHRGSSSTGSEKESDLAQGFTYRDQQVLRDLASHVSVIIQSMNDEETKLGLSETIKILKVTKKRKDDARTKFGRADTPSGPLAGYE